jgi:hypothetical protein
MGGVSPQVMAKVESQKKNDMPPSSSNVQSQLANSASKKLPPTPPPKPSQPNPQLQSVSSSANTAHAQKAGVPEARSKLSGMKLPSPESSSGATKPSTLAFDTASKIMETGNASPQLIALSKTYLGLRSQLKSYSNLSSTSLAVELEKFSSKLESLEKFPNKDRSLSVDIHTYVKDLKNEINNLEKSASNSKNELIDAANKKNTELTTEIRSCTGQESIDVVSKKIEEFKTHIKENPDLQNDRGMSRVGQMLDGLLAVKKKSMIDEGIKQMNSLPENGNIVINNVQYIFQPTQSGGFRIQTRAQWDDSSRDGVFCAGPGNPINLNQQPSGGGVGELPSPYKEIINLLQNK